MSDTRLPLRTYRGWIAEHSYGEADDDILFLSEVSDPLAEALQDDIRALGSFLTVRYFISDRALDAEELEENLVKQIVGAGDADFGSRYSEITGYLWTDESLTVGGHDLLDELRSHKGQFAHLEVQFAKEPR